MDEVYDCHSGRLQTGLLPSSHSKRLESPGCHGTRRGGRTRAFTRCPGDSGAPSRNLIAPCGGRRRKGDPICQVQAALHPVTESAGRGGLRQIRRDDGLGNYARSRFFTPANFATSGQPRRFRKTARAASSAESRSGAGRQSMRRNERIMVARWRLPGSSCSDSQFQPSALPRPGGRRSRLHSEFLRTSQEQTAPRVRSATGLQSPD